MAAVARREAACLLILASTASALWRKNSEANPEVLSYDLQGWEPLAKKHRSGLPTSRSGVCMHGRAVPQVYLLGVQKAGTTTMATDLMEAGLESAIGQYKELHLFDRQCGFNVSYPLFGAKERVRGCNASSFNASWWERIFRPCSEGGGPFADMTPLNQRLPGLPALLSSIYGTSKADLTFILALRDPLHRFQSGFYQRLARHRTVFNSTFNVSFSKYVRRVRKRWPKSADPASDGAATDYLLDQMYRSMYGLSLVPWLEEFAPSQFILVPMGKYFSSADARRSAFTAIAAKSNASLDLGVLTKNTVANHRKHAALGEDLSEDLQAQLQKEFFEPDSHRLADLLAPAVRDGLQINGYTGPPNSADIRKYLLDSW